MIPGIPPGTASGLDLRGRGWVVYFGGWLLLALFLGSQTALYTAYAGRPVSWQQAFLFPLVNSLLWSGLALPVLALVRRHPIGPGRWGRSLAVHGFAALVCAALAGSSSFAILHALGALGNAPWPLSRLFGGLLLGRLHGHLITYAAVAGVGHLVLAHRMAGEKALRASQLEANLARARLQMLRMQLQPHFLFNTLHAISSLMHRDPETADRMLARLSELLRVAMQTETEPTVPLRLELEFLRSYLEIQQMRFGERLRVRIEVPPEVLDARVPSLILQPLVENAVRHGMGARAAGGCVEVVAQRDGGALVVSVTDDGPGLPPEGSDSMRSGLGLSNTRERLQQMYGGEGRLELEAPPKGGLRVVLRLPFHGEATGDPP